MKPVSIACLTAPQPMNNRRVATHTELPVLRRHVRHSTHSTEMHQKCTGLQLNLTGTLFAR